MATFKLSQKKLNYYYVLSKISITICEMNQPNVQLMLMGLFKNLKSKFIN